MDASLNPDPDDLPALHHILEDRERPFYAHKVADYMSLSPYQVILKTFLEDASKWVTEPCSLDIRFGARKLKAGDNYEIVAAHLAVVPFPLSDSQTFEFSIEVGDFWFGHERLHDVPASVALQIIKDACDGRLSLYSKVISVSSTDKHYTRANLGDEWFVSHAGLLLTTYPQSAGRPRVTSEVHDELRRSSTPFDGLPDLLNWLDLANDFNDEGPTKLRINIAAPADIATDKTKVVNGEVHLTVIAHPTLDPNSLHVAIRGAPPKGVTSRLQVAEKLQWTPPSKGTKFGNVVISLPGVDAAQVMLSVGNQYVRRHWFVDPVRSQNERYLAMRLFDGNLKMVRRYLLDDHNPDKFELAVAALIFMMGFNPAVQCETDAADIVVMTPSGRLMLVECTLKLADVPAKVGKLVHRREALAKALSTEGRVVQVLSVLACQADYAQVAAYELDLANKGVLLLAKERLARQIESGLHNPVDPEEMYMSMVERLSQLTAPMPSPSDPTEAM